MDVMEKSKVYINVDDKNRIIQIDGGYTLSNITNTDEWMLIDEGYGDRFNLCQGNYLPYPINDMMGIARFKIAENPQEGDGNLHTYLHDGVFYGIYERTQEEMDADYAALPAPPASDAERIKALEEQLAGYEAAFAEGVSEGWA